MPSTPDTVTLQNKVSPEDIDWIYWNVNIPEIPSSSKDGKVPIKFITVTKERIELKIEFRELNRILTAGDSKFMGISFANFCFDDLSPKVTADYVERLLKVGIRINGVKYFLYGHSNSQLQSRTCLLYAASNGEELFKKINTFGDFWKINSVSKRAKRVGQLFTTAVSQLQLDPKFTLDIDDVERNGHIFTDGCGLVSKYYANIIARKTKIIFHNTKYVPSVYQIRYKGYKGTVMLDPNLPKGNHFQFVKSMKKFSNCPDNTFSVKDYSKPYNFGFLNGELITLLSTLGIPDEVFKKKQKDYFEFLKQASTDPITAFMYLSYKEKNDIAEKILLNGIDKVTLRTINGLKKDEWERSCPSGPKEKVRVRIFIPLSRFMFGVSDHTGTLQEGEVHVRIKVEGMTNLTISDMEVIVSRNPCLHPGDIRKFKAVCYENLNHLVDCIVFPIVGERDAPSLMSGGDLDGDKFFVSWDSEIIPEKLYEPYGYPPAKEQPKREINYESMVKYFAHYNNASLGKVKNLYLGWARVCEDIAGSKECQELNALFSSCVDGERVNIPERLPEPPKPKDGSKPFILDLLCEEVKENNSLIKNFLQNKPEESTDTNTTPFELMEFMLTSNALCLDEFELFQMAFKWCLCNKFPIENLLPYFNFGTLTLPQKHIVACQFKQRKVKIKYFQSLFNGLHSSKLLNSEQLIEQNLHHANIYWQKFYDSSDDDGRRLETCLSKSLELFERKLLVIRVDSELIIAIYIAQKIVQDEEIDIGKVKDRVKLFAFSSTGQKQNYRKLAERNYKIYFNGKYLQLYDKHRRNTFVKFVLQNENSPSNRIREPVRNKMVIEKRRRNNQVETSVKPEMPEFKISIALPKFSRELSESRSLVTKKESKGFEIYVISNRDRIGYQLLDLSMSQVDTKTIVKLQNNIPKEYKLTEDFERIDWDFRVFSRSIIFDRKLEELKNLNGIDQFEQIFFICEALADEDVGDTIFASIVQYVLTDFNSFDKKDEIWVEIFRHLHKFPKASSLLVDKIYESVFLVDENLESVLSVYPLKEYQCLFLIDNIIQSANSGRELTFAVYEKLVQIVIHFKWVFSVKELTSLVKCIVYSVRLADVAEKLLRELFNDEIQIFNFDETSNSENEICFRYLKKFIMSLALNYLGEVKDNCPCDFWGIPQGAEDKEDDPNSKARNYRKPVEKVVIADFMYQVLNSKVRNGSSPIDTSIGTPPVTPYRGVKPIAAMKCLEIQTTDQSDKGFYRTALRTDIQNKIRNGDHLIFCASRRAIDKNKRRVTVFNAIAYSIKRGELIFEMREREPRELFSASWNVYISTSTTDFNSMLSALKNLISSKAKSTSAFTSILELPQNNPEIVGTFEILEADIPPNEFFNEMQIEAVKKAVNSPLTLIWGPPGTGKTTVVVEILLQFIQLRGGLSILVAASTHNAVDNVLSKFLKERARRFGGDKSEDVVRIASDMEKITVSELKKYTLNAYVGADIHTNDKAKKAALKKLQNARVVFSTCSGAGVGLLRLPDDDDDNEIGGRKKKKQKEISFDVVIVDEASQVTEPNALIPIVKKSMFVILVGDHVQLRPTVSQIAKDCELETSLFEKLYLSQNLSDISCAKIMLNVQYRMNPLLADFPSRTFYEGKLLSGINEDSRIIPASKFPWPTKGEEIGIFPAVFIQCSSLETYFTGSTSKMNTGQVKLTIDIIKSLTSSGDSLYSITVLSPYAKQVAKIQSEVKSANLKAEVKTIDSYQGRESDIIIFSTVRANCHNDLGFLEDRRRMNVALTRAKLGLIIIGDENTLFGNELWKNCIASCKKIDFKAENSMKNS